MATKISAVIPTFNRRARLERVLSALDEQTLVEGLEVVVVDDGSSDGTSEWLEKQQYRFRLVPVHQKNSGPAVARNTGIDAASGDLVLFLDDDVVPTPTLVQEHVESHREADNLVVIGPLCSLDHYDQPWVAWEQARLEEQYAAMQRGDWAPTFRQFWTGNASVARHHLLEAGKFDPTYLRGEDVELGHRLDQRGIQFRFNPNARGYHHAERSLASWENAHRSYGELEVRMLYSRGASRHLDMLAGNWSRVHPLTRLLTLHCVQDPLRFGVARRLLQACVQGPIPRRVTEKALSALANLLYWEACGRALGPERFQSVLAGGDEMRREARQAAGSRG